MAAEDSQTKLDESIDAPNGAQNLQQHNSTNASSLLQATPIEKEKKLWSCHINRVVQLHNEIANVEMFDKLNVFELQTKLTRLQKAMKELDDQDLQVKMFDDPNPAEHDRKQEEVTALSDVYQARILARIAELRNAERHHGVLLKRQATAVAQSSIGTAPSAEPVPKKQITWGMFAGSVYEWHAFSKRFTKEVHDDPSLTPDDKLLLLQKSCFDQAKEIIDSVDKSYEEAYRSLNEAYGNVYNTMHHAIQRILSYPAIAVATYDEITRLMQTGKKCMEMMDGVKAAEKFDPFLVILAASKLDGFTSKAWVRYRSILAATWAEVVDKNDQPREKRLFMPTWDEFVKFLKDECSMYVQEDIQQALVAGIAPGATQSRVSIGANAGTSGPTQIGQSSARANQKSGPIDKRNVNPDLQCKLCDGTHMPYKCEEFKRLTLSQRWDHVEKAGLCPRCLRKYHQSDCINKQNNECCSRCWQRDRKEVRHNSALCPVASGYVHEQPRSSDPPEEDWE